MPRLPIVDADLDTWGEILNEFLSVSLNGDGTVNLVAAEAAGLAPITSPMLLGTPTAETAAPGTNTTQLATTAFVEAAGGGPPSGSAGGDLSATFPNPVVTKASGNFPVAGDITLPDSSFDTNTGGFTGGGLRSGIGHEIDNTFTQNVGPVIASAAAPSIGANVSGLTSVTVNSIGNPPTTGTINVTTTGGTSPAKFTYTGISGDTFTGTSLISGSGTVAAVGDGVGTDLTTIDPFIGTSLLVKYNPTINYDGGGAGLGPITYTSAPIGPRGIVEVEGICTYKVSNTTANGIPPVFQNEMSYKNDPSVAVDFCVGEGFVNTPSAIGDTTHSNFVPINNTFNIPGQGQNWTIGYTDFPLFVTENGGTLGATNPGQTVSFYSTALFSTGVTVAQRIGLMVNDTTGGGTVGANYGIRIGNVQADGETLLPMVGAFLNYGIDCANPVILSGTTNTLLSTPFVPPLAVFGGTKTLNFASAAYGNLVAVNGTLRFQQGAALVAGSGFAYTPIIENLVGNSAALGLNVGFAASPTIRADTQTLASGGSFFGLDASPQVGVVNSGSITMAQVVAVESSPTVNTGATVSSVAAVSVLDVGGSGTVTFQAGVDIPILKRGATNHGVRIGQGGTTLTSAPSFKPLVIYDGTTTLNYANAILPGAIDIAPTISLSQSAFSLGLFTGIAFAPTISQTTAVNYGPVVGLQVNPTFAGTSAGTGSASAFGVAFSPSLATSGSGSITSGNLIGLQHGATIGTGVSLTESIGLSFLDGSGSGAVATQIGVDIAALTKGTTNIGVRIGATNNALQMAFSPTGPTTGALVSNTNGVMSLYFGGVAYYLLIAFNDAGTVRYKYLELTGTTTTWGEGTTLPT